MQTKVLIIGAGPTGLMMASQLSRFGIDYIIIDQKTTITDKSKALAVQARTMEVYQQMGIAEDAVEQGMIGRAVNFVINGKRLRRINLANIGEGLSPFPYINMLEQSKNEALLNNFVEQHGNGVLWNTRLESFTQNEEEVTAILHHKNGEQLTIKADWLVGADGARSPVRKQLGMTFKGDTHEQTFFVADVQLTWEFEGHELFICLDKNNFLACFPMKGDRHFRLVGAVPESLLNKEGLTFEDVLVDLLPKLNFELKLNEVRWFATYKIHHRVVSNFQRGRCFLAGDAAHIHSPAGGQGMNTGLMDAYNLAWKLALVIQEKVNPKLLKTYNEERLPFAQQLVNTTDTAFETIISNNPLVRFFRLNILPTALRAATSFEQTRKLAFRTVSQTAVNYRLYSLSRNGAAANFSTQTPQAGDRFPYFPTKDGTTFDWLKGTTFQVLYFFTKETPEITDRLSKYLNLSQLDFHLRLIDKSTNPTVFDALGIKAEGLFIIRPDMYIGYRSDRVDLGDLEIYFEKHIS